MSGEMTLREKLHDLLYSIPATLVLLAVVYTMHLCLNDYRDRVSRINCELIWGDCPE